jgi:adenine-specific DNA-methyltransferase
MEKDYKKLGQYFTKNIILKEKVYEFIKNKPELILEPSMGQGDLVEFVKQKIEKESNTNNIDFDLYEIDNKITILESLESLKEKIIYGDFIKQIITKKYKTIIGNPPYVKKTKGNLYLEFIEKCYNYLEENGELIFIVPSDFLKLTSSSKLLNLMFSKGTITHVFHPNNEKLFENATIDVIVFRYEKTKQMDFSKVLYNDKEMYIQNKEGLITFAEEKLESKKYINDFFNVYVGIVSGKEEIYKNEEFGNIEIITGDSKKEKYILIEKFPCENEKINKYLLENKEILIERKIKKFNEKNWFEWGALRNIKQIKEHLGKDCIYIYNLTRKDKVAFIGKVNYFNGNLLILIPNQEISLEKLINIVDYLNSENFKKNFIFSGRFKIGHRQICNSLIS